MTVSNFGGSILYSCFVLRTNLAHVRSNLFAESSLRTFFTARLVTVWLHTQTTGQKTVGKTFASVFLCCPTFRAGYTGIIDIWFRPVGPYFTIFTQSLGTLCSIECQLFALLAQLCTPFCPFCWCPFTIRAFCTKFPCLTWLVVAHCTWCAFGKIFPCHTLWYFR